MVQTFTALISILGADSARLSVAAGLTCKGGGEGERPISGGGISGGGCPPSCSCTIGSCSCSVDLTPLVSHVCDWSLLATPVTVFTKPWWKLLLAKKRPDKTRILSPIKTKIETINKLHLQLRPRSIYPFLFENHLSMRLNIYIYSYLFFPDNNVRHFIIGPTCNKVSFPRRRTLIINNKTIKWKGQKPKKNVQTVLEQVTWKIHVWFSVSIWWFWQKMYRCGHDHFHMQSLFHPPERWLLEQMLSLSGSWKSPKVKFEDNHTNQSLLPGCQPIDGCDRHWSMHNLCI